MPLLKNRNKERGKIKRRNNLPKSRFAQMKSRIILLESRFRESFLEVEKPKSNFWYLTLLLLVRGFSIARIEPCRQNPKAQSCSCRLCFFCRHSYS